jgi:hypothetical protein
MLVAITTTLGFLFGLALPSQMWGWVGRIAFAILVGMIALSVSLNYFDNMVIEETTVGQPASTKIVDKYDGGYYLLFWHDLSIKLENGKILKFDDPYKWKQFEVGGQYNYTKYQAFSHVEGNVTYADYTYMGVI